jgi:hypothetical protein
VRLHSGFNNARHFSLLCCVSGKRAKLILEQDTPNLRWCGAPPFGQAFDFLERVVFNPNCKPALRRTIALIHWPCSESAAMVGFVREVSNAFASVLNFPQAGGSGCQRWRP